MKLVDEASERMWRSAKLKGQLHINEVRYTDWIMLDEAIVPVNTEYGTWPNMNDHKWSMIGSSHSMTCFQSGDIIIIVENIYGEIVFRSMRSRVATAMVKTPVDLIRFATTAADYAKDMEDPVPAAKAFGKVVYIITELIKQQQPEQLTFSGQGRVGSLYRRAFKSQASLKVFKDLGYDVKHQGDAELVPGVVASSFSITKTLR